MSDVPIPDGPVGFAHLADLASYGQGVIALSVCARCGAAVPAAHQARHARWHAQLLDGGGGR